MESQQKSFDCRICLENATEPVVTQCGHLYCWSCIDKWMSQNHSCLSCPVCKSGISREKLVPIYINENSKDPRTSNPRPNATRSPPEPNSSYARTQPDVNFNIGFGLFPGLFGLSFNIPMTRSQNSDTMTKIMFVLLILFILTILF